MTGKKTTTKKKKYGKNNKPNEEEDNSKGEIMLLSSSSSSTSSSSSSSTRMVVEVNIRTECVCSIDRLLLTHGRIGVVSDLLLSKVQIYNDASASSSDEAIAAAMAVNEALIGLRDEHEVSRSVSQSFGPP